MKRTKIRKIKHPIEMPEFLKSKKRKKKETMEREIMERTIDELAEINQREQEQEEAKRHQILYKYRLIKEKKSKLNRRERDNFMVELHALVKKGFIKLEEKIEDI